ncbi:MAG TPA: kelch repeat-containing protein [Thermomicrobiales bacterium]|nr:kelch repeat-containing protein [Thermomicrobiales bacterium]
MRRLPRILVTIALAALLGGLAGGAPAARAAAPPPGGTWIPLPPLHVARTAHTATTLADGRVLVAGVGSSEVFDPATGAWSAPTPMVDKRYGQAAVRLPDGRVLVTGGTPARSDQTLASAELYDPATGRWTAAAPMRTARIYHTATLLRDGRVLVAGGDTTGPNAPKIAAAELYDPAANTWSSGGVMHVARSGHTATLLRDGRVLVVGGDAGAAGAPDTPATAEVFDPTNGTWTPVAPLGTARIGHAAALLPDGRVLVTGGRGLRTTDTTALFDPATGKWTPGAPMLVPRADHTATALPGGRVLVAGGWRAYDFKSVQATAELYDPATNSWSLTGPLPARVRGQQAALLPDGRVLLVGGDDTQRAAMLYADTPPPAACFAATGQCLRGRFLQYWQEHGGLAINGFPISGEFVELLEDGQYYQVQYFERARFEYHPENPAPYDVLLGAFGRHFYPVDTFFPTKNAAQPLPGATYFPQTGHNVRGKILVYWQANGGLAQFGYPLSEEIQEQLEDGKTYTVQYFERARFELHPENPPPYDVELGQFGRRILAESQLLTGTIGRVYRTSAGLRDRLGAPRTAVALAPGVTQQFQKGWMFYRGDTRQIYAICFPSSIWNGTWSVYPDTWAEGQPVGGGPGPSPGLYEPRRGFGKVWREHPDVRQCLGYAKTADETAFTLPLQPFAHGLMLLDTTYPAAGGQLFVLYDDGTYELVLPTVE